MAVVYTYCCPLLTTSQELVSKFANFTAADAAGGSAAAGPQSATSAPPPPPPKAAQPQSPAPTAPQTPKKTAAPAVLGEHELLYVLTAAAIVLTACHSLQPSFSAAQSASTIGAPLCHRLTG